MTERSSGGKWKRLNMGWRVLIGFQASKRAFMVSVFGILSLDVGMGSFPILLSSSTCFLYHFFGITDGVMVFF